VLRRPAVWVDAVQDVSSVVIDCPQCANDSEALVAGRLDTHHALVECSLNQHSTSLAYIVVSIVFKSAPQILLVCSELEHLQWFSGCLRSWIIAMIDGMCSTQG